MGLTFASNHRSSTKQKQNTSLGPREAGEMFISVWMEAEFCCSFIPDGRSLQYLLSTAFLKLTSRRAMVVNLFFSLSDQ